MENTFSSKYISNNTNFTTSSGTGGEFGNPTTLSGTSPDPTISGKFISGCNYYGKINPSDFLKTVHKNALIPFRQKFSDTQESEKLKIPITGSEESTKTFSQYKLSNSPNSLLLLKKQKISAKGISRNKFFDLNSGGNPTTLKLNFR